MNLKHQKTNDPCKHDDLKGTIALVVFACVFGYFAFPTAQELDSVANRTVLQSLERVDAYEACGDLSKEEADKIRELIVYDAQPNAWKVTK